MNRIITFICIALMASTSLMARKDKTRGLEVGTSITIDGKASVLMPELGYRWGRLGGVSIVGLLPMHDRAEKRDDTFTINGFLGQTTGLELRLNLDIPILSRLSVGLSAVGGYGLTGYYDQVDRKSIGVFGGEPDQSSSYDTHRTWVGLRPVLKYRLASSWIIKAGLGFWGYASNDNQMTNYLGDQKQYPQWVERQSYTGFTTSARYGAGLNIGLTKIL